MCIVVVDSECTITSNPTDSTSDAWTTPMASTSGTGFTVAVFEKVSTDGDEDGGTLAVVHDGGSETWQAVVIPVTGSHASAATEVGTPATGSDTAPEPPNVSYSGGAVDNLFMALVGFNRAGDNLTGGPTGYTFDATEDATTAGGSWAETGGTTSGAGLGFATLQTVADQADDPDAFTLDATGDWLTNTLVIPPAAAGGGSILPQMMRHYY